MPSAPLIGEVYFVAAFPGLHGHAAKSRYCVVVHPSDKPKSGGVLVVPVSTSSLSPFRVALPNEEQNPGCASGLPKRSDAVCDECKIIDAAQLTNRRGRLTTVMTNRLMAEARRYLKSKGVGS